MLLSILFSGVATAMNDQAGQATCTGILRPVFVTISDVLGEKASLC